jgi:hypothetical protein
VFTGLWFGGLKRRHYQEDLGIGWRITLRWTSGGIDGVNWIRLAQDRFQWWAFVGFIKKAGYSLKS